jgi:hypothetical protein
MKVRKTLRTGRIGRLLIAIVAALVAASTLTGCSLKPIVLVFGDSLVSESRAPIGFQLGDSYDVRIVAHGGTALCDWAQIIVGDVRELQPKVVMIAFTGNALTGCMQNSDGSPVTEATAAVKYEADLNWILANISGPGRRVVVVGGPPTVVIDSAAVGMAPNQIAGESLGVDATIGPSTVSPSVSWGIGTLPVGRMSSEAYVNVGYRRVVAKYQTQGMAVMYVDGGMHMRAPGGGWTKVMPCYPFEVSNTQACVDGLVNVRSADFGHFCPTTAAPIAGVVPTCEVWSSGAWRYAAAMTAAVRYGEQPTGGSFDSAVVGDGQVTVSGWAIDPDAPDRPIDVHLYVDGAWGGQARADRSRPDVGNVFPYVGPDHGYVAVVKAAPGPHNVCVWAINGFGPDRSNNVSLGCRTVTIAPTSPFGNYENLGAATPGRITLSGWTIDPSNSAPIRIVVRVNGVISGRWVANAPRPDVGSAYPAFGSAHGFNVSLAAARGTATVCVTAINVGSGSNQSLGCRTVEVR